jgi:methyl-accepting chemotaxis protein
MNKLTLKLKLAVGFGALLLTLVVMGTMSYFSVRSLEELSGRADNMAEERYLLRSIEAALNERKTDIRSFLLTADEKQMKRYQECNQSLADDFDQLQALLLTDQGKALLAQLRQTTDAYDRGAQRVAQLKRSGRTRQATALLFGQEMVEVRDQMETTVVDFIEMAAKLKSNARDEQATAESKAKSLIFLVSPAGIVIGLVMATVTSRGITHAAANMVAMIEQVAANNLAIADMEVTSEDELGHASIALNTMKNNLRGLIQSIARTAEHVASASEELSSSASEQAQSAEIQKGQATQVSVAMHEMSGTVGEVSENSTRAAEAARQAAETAREGGTIVEDSLTKMRVIAESVSATAQKVEELGRNSDQIGRIIGVIDDIADQTNLLALNAAIEAARAGEQGRGFAVVADEVRKLAERTTSATKEVAQMVQGIQNGTKTAVAAMRDGTEQVQDGVKTTARAGDSLKQIIHMSEEVGRMIAHIATAATEQSSAAEQVNQNVEQITRLVSQSAIGAKESARACQDLSSLALDLQKMVSSFNLDGTRADANSLARQDWSGEKPALAEENKMFAASAG